MTATTLLVAALLLIIVALSLVILAFLRRWSFAFSDGERIIAPAYDWKQTITSFQKSFNETSKAINRTLKDLQKSNTQQFEEWQNTLATHHEAHKRIHALLSQVYQETAGLHETTKILRGEIQTQATELDRHRKGYDFEILKRSLVPICRIHRTLNLEIQHERIDGAAQAFLEQFIDDCHETLEDAGVTITWPQPNQQIREMKNIRHPPSTVFTDNPERVGTIAAVDSPAYEFNSSNGTQILLPAQVGVYVLAPKESEIDEQAQTNS